MKLKKIKTCKLCGSILMTLKHHPDYSRPSKTITLCSRCHGKVHTSLKEHGINLNSKKYYGNREHLCVTKMTKELIMEDCVRIFLKRNPHYNGMNITVNIIVEKIASFYIDKNE